jgi:hypothetical protein
VALHSRNNVIEKFKFFYMEISSFETTAFTRRQAERLEQTGKSPINILRYIFGIGLMCGCGVLLTKIPMNSVTANFLTPNRLLILVTVVLIIITPKLRRSAPVKPHHAPDDSKVVHAPTETQPILTPPKPLFSRMERMAEPGQTYQAISPHFTQSFAPIPTRYDSSSLVTPRKLTSIGGHAAPAPFVDDIHSVQKHEYSEILPRWSRMIEEQVVMPQIIIPFVRAMEESDAQITHVFGLHGYRLGRVPGTGVICLTDRFLPAPLSSNQEINALWQRRQLLESLVNLPGYSQQYRDYIVSRITTWASRGGIRFAYRPETRPDESGPSDSHILSHLLFSSFDTQMTNSGGNTFRDRFVVESSSLATTTSDDEFTSLFSSLGLRLSGLTNHHSRMVWLEQSSRGGSLGVLHFNVATNQRVYGIPQGAGNLLESLCIFFHLLKKLSPQSVWLQIPHEIRVTLEALLSAGPGSTSLSGGLVNGLSTSAALGY